MSMMLIGLSNMAMALARAVERAEKGTYAMAIEFDPGRNTVSLQSCITHKHLLAETASSTGLHNSSTTHDPFTTVVGCSFPPSRS